MPRDRSVSDSYIPDCCNFAVWSAVGGVRAASVAIYRHSSRILSMLLLWIIMHFWGYFDYYEFLQSTFDFLTKIMFSNHLVNYFQNFRKRPVELVHCNTWQLFCSGCRIRRSEDKLSLLLQVHLLFILRKSYCKTYVSDNNYHQKNIES